MQRIEAEFEIVTPMFLGGADPKATAELRASSIKGALRFWWRALAWSRLGGDFARIRAEEAHTFGSSDDKIGQSKILVQVEWINRAKTLVPPPTMSTDEILSVPEQNNRKSIKRNYRLTVDGTAAGSAVGEGARYLGYGLVEAFGRNRKIPRTQDVIDVFVPGELSRPCLFHRNATGSPSTFRVLFASREPFQNDFIAALKLFGLMGGLGSRTRRGYGSVSLQRITRIGYESHIVCLSPNTREAYIAELRSLLTPTLIADSTLSPLTAFGNGSRVDVTRWQKTDTLETLDLLGRGMQRYRSWGRGGNVNGQPSERLFSDDHHWSKQRPRDRGPYVPHRTAFGLPHKYGDNLVVSGPSKEMDRRSSPLMFHIHKTADGNCFGVALLLPTQFLPGTDVKIDNYKYRYVFDPSVLTHFLDDCGTAGATGTERFLDGQTVIP